jgi:hypothetical protein
VRGVPTNGLAANSPKCRAVTNCIRMETDMDGGGGLSEASVTCITRVHVGNVS